MHVLCVHQGEVKYELRLAMVLSGGALLTWRECIHLDVCVKLLSMHRNFKIINFIIFLLFID